MRQIPRWLKSSNHPGLHQGLGDWNGVWVSLWLQCPSWRLCALVGLAVVSRALCAGSAMDPHLTGREQDSESGPGCPISSFIQVAGCMRMSRFLYRPAALPSPGRSCCSGFTPHSDRWGRFRQGASIPPGPGLTGWRRGSGSHSTSDSTQRTWLFPRRTRWGNLPSHSRRQMVVALSFTLS